MYNMQRSILPNIQKIIRTGLRFKSGCSKPCCPVFVSQECPSIKELPCTKPTPPIPYCYIPQKTKLGDDCVEKVCRPCCLPIETPVTNDRASEPNLSRCIQLCPYPSYPETTNYYHYKPKRCRAGKVCIPEPEPKCYGTKFSMPHQHPLARRYFYNKESKDKTRQNICHKKPDPCDKY